VEMVEGVHTGLQPGFYSWLLQLGKRQADSAEAFGEHFRVDAHSDADVIGHVEEAAGDG